ncbi:MAG: trypsin-like peptidase domain-containing protein [Desulfobacterales bacterium]|jgi:S1-C subfamily serine protease|nr:trypsin-like peptidase domain-containing protein [Desulfobacterales bacterium]
MDKRISSAGTLLVVWLAISLFPVGLGNAGVYKYKDENGVWHFSDAPASLPDESEAMTGMIERDTGIIDLRAKLEKALSPQNDIEKAITATVAVKSTIGSGSGFFISGDGYILTNKHVLQFTEVQEKQVDAAFEAADSDLRNIEDKFKLEEAQLSSAKKDIEKTKAVIDSQPDSAVKELNTSRYLSDFQSIVAWEENFLKRKKMLSQRKKELWHQKTDYQRDASVAALNQTFSVILADNTTLSAYLVKRSENYDLALLKVDGVSTPFLEPARFNETADGDAVYAIGNPLEFRNSVASGTLSGVEGDFAKTDAKIYPGNSGGPLVTKGGKVIGVNTYKEITHKFEGMGFAIIIERALAEFRELI